VEACLEDQRDRATQHSQSPSRSAASCTPARWLCRGSVHQPPLLHTSPCSRGLARTAGAGTSSRGWRVQQGRRRGAHLAPGVVQQDLLALWAPQLRAVLRAPVQLPGAAPPAAQGSPGPPRVATERRRRAAPGQVVPAALQRSWLLRGARLLPATSAGAQSGAVNAGPWRAAAAAARAQPCTAAVLRRRPRSGALPTSGSRPH
jgi:hypothetical protein